MKQLKIYKRKTRKENFNIYDTISLSIEKLSHIKSADMIFTRYEREENKADKIKK